jgi:hypothetical protein
LVFSQNRGVPQKCTQLKTLVTKELELILELYWNYIDVCFKF